MSDASIQLVKDFYAAFMAGDVPKVLTYLSPDFVLELPEMEEVPLPTICRGHQGFLDFLTARAPVIAYRRFEPLTFMAAGDEVLVRGETDGTVLTTSQPFSYRWVQHFRVGEDGTIAYLFEAFDTLQLARCFTRHAGQAVAGEAPTAAR